MYFEYVKPLVPKTLEYVDTKNGTLRGYKTRDIYAFKNVQYGECKRWQTATPVKPWKGIKNALQFGPRMFPGNLAFTPWDSCGVAHEAYDYAEDALNLNLWTPTIDPNAKKPVMVWIHGGGYSTGSAMEMQCHDGENQARFGDVVVVQLNHRLNIFGFLDCSKFGPQYANSGNAGLSDLVLALQWIHDNIAAFGGDPDNVLIHGQSGGGMKVTSLMQIPAADGLFHKVIAQSGVPSKRNLRSEDSTKSEAVLEELFKIYNTDKIETLEELTPEELLETYNQKVVPALAEKGFVGMAANNWNGIAGDYYIGNPHEHGFTEHAKTIPMMVGCTISEFPAMRILNKHSYTEEQQMDILRECFPDQDVDKLAQLFKQAWPDKCLTDAIETDGRLPMRMSVIDMLDLRAETCSAPTWGYMFSHDFPQEGGRGAWHCAELPIIFHNSCDYPPEFREGVVGPLEDAIAGSWAAFAHNSDPNSQYIPVEWPTYKPGECAQIIFDDVITVKNDFDREYSEMRSTMDLHVTDKYTKFEQVVN